MHSTRVATSEDGTVCISKEAPKASRPPMAQMHPYGQNICRWLRGWDPGGLID